jgi:hypothetical protein
MIKFYKIFTFYSSLQVHHHVVAKTLCAGYLKNCFLRKLFTVYAKKIAPAEKIAPLFSYFATQRKQ